MIFNQIPSAHPTWCIPDHLPGGTPYYAAIWEVSPGDGAEILGLEIRVPGHGYGDDPHFDVDLGDGTRLRGFGYDAWSLHDLAGTLRAASDRLHENEQDATLLEEPFRDAFAPDWHDRPTTGIIPASSDRLNESEQDANWLEELYRDAFPPGWHDSPTTDTTPSA